MDRFPHPVAKSGSATLLVLGVLTLCMALLAGSQSFLKRSSVDLGIDSVQQELRTAAVLGLREGMSLLADDDTPSFDDLREDWASPLTFISSEGVAVQIQVQDAQRRFNLNRLSQPLSPSMVRTPDEMFADLVQASGMEDEAGLSRTLGPWLRANEVELQDPLQLISIDPDFVEVLSFVGSSLTALPRPETGALTVNLNTVDPEVLTAILGPQFRGWVQTVLSARESAPIPSVSAVTRGLPAIAQSVLPQVLDVRSDYFEIMVVCEKNRILREYFTLVRRPTTGTVEVIRCQW